MAQALAYDLRMHFIFQEVSGVRVPESVEGHLPDSSSLN
jgi:hypothetical protein